MMIGWAYRYNIPYIATPIVSPPPSLRGPHTDFVYKQSPFSSIGRLFRLVPSNCALAIMSLIYGLEEKGSSFTAKRGVKQAENTRTSDQFTEL